MEIRNGNSIITDWDNRHGASHQSGGADPISGTLLVSESAAPSAAAAVTFSGLSPGKEYMLIMSLRQNTSAGNLSIRFNSDSGANYIWCMYGVNQDPAAGGSAVANDTQHYLMSNTAAAGSGHRHTVNFSTDPGDTTIVLHTAETLWKYSGDSKINRHMSGGQYDGAADLSSVTIAPSAGTITGNIYLLEVQP